MIAWCLCCGYRDDHRDAAGKCRIHNPRGRIIAWVDRLGHAHCVTHREQREGDDPMRVADASTDDRCDWPGCGADLAKIARAV